MRLRHPVQLLCALVVVFLLTLSALNATAQESDTGSESTEQTDTKGLVITIRPTGFIPTEIEVTQGRYLFIIQNRSGIRDLTFVLDRQAGDRVHEVRDQKLQWKKRVDLHPGTYVLSVTGHAKWNCTVKVKPR